MHGKKKLDLRNIKEEKREAGLEHNLDVWTKGEESSGMNDRKVLYKVVVLLSVSEDFGRQIRILGYVKFMLIAKHPGWRPVRLEKCS